MNYLNRVGGGYETPTLEVIELAVEQGFAASPNANDWDEGENDWFEK